MNCPYCNTEMEIGVIQSSQEISWLKGEKRKFLVRAEFHDGSVVLSESSFIKGSAVLAHLCRGCQKVIIDFSDPSSDLNQR